MPGRILIVESDERVRSAVCGALQRHGIVGDELNDSSEAVAAIRSRRYDIVLLEVPAGFAALKTVRDDTDRPVIIALSDSEDDVRQLAGESAVTISINKDFAMDNMEPVIAAIAAVARMR